ncbi:hypothetical protein PROAA_550005 [Candidatus Propionivibrio aalborgensis]|uniref:Transposase n=1 Tax=Candidatus Propionivibrio aalborgensis TaxID=1860101 RepID=A0A1A8Y053_9RHOO|nr:hypothetical protein PROAA_550005 [Candidatus Propionivibrio aalborgensis]
MSQSCAAILSYAAWTIDAAVRESGPVSYGRAVSCKSVARGMVFRALMMCYSRIRQYGWGWPHLHEPEVRGGIQL